MPTKCILFDVWIEGYMPVIAVAVISLLHYFSYKGMRNEVPLSHI